MPEKITNVHLSECSHFEHTCYNQQIFLDEERETHLFDLWQYWQNRTIRIEFSPFTKSYVLSMYWSALTITTLGEQPSPNETFQSVFEILDTVIGMLLFAGIVGSVADLVATANRVKTDWQQRMDSLKQFMMYRNIHSEFQQRVLKYCEYEMSKMENMSELEMRNYLPPKLYTQVNRYAQWTVLTKSPLFKSCEVSFLKDVVAYLKPRDFGPGEVVCARGELNREMFVVASGYLEIVDHNNVTLKTFCEGDIVEDKSLLWFPNNCYENRKKYDVISIGYSQVYILFPDDLLRVLSDYPQCRESVRTQAELMQREAGELFDEAVTTEIDDFEGSSLEERLISIRSVLSALESSVNVSYENFKVLAHFHVIHIVYVLDDSYLEIKHFRMWSIISMMVLVGTAFSLRCYEGTLRGLTNNAKTEEKSCSAISNYCIQKIDKKKNQIRRECSSFSDEHNMEEKCPTSGCHWQSANETFCCCQFDGCNEWKADGTEYKEGEMVTLNTFTTSSTSPREKAQRSENFVNTPKTSIRTPVARSDLISVD
ncbi:hypothetical protein Angca_006664 [Angiostrongylus cantonensis]|nr:hypothetical protein Angca_006664 [Angiostrongylus cantonensis]